MRTVFAVAGVLGHPPLRFLTSRHTILSDVVVVILAVATRLDASCQVGTRALPVSGRHRLPPFGRPRTAWRRLAEAVAAHAMATFA